jgi:ATP-dependent HslUV protease ATP-binding subunit HslU
MTNEQNENIGARRLHTIMEKLLEDISFGIPDDIESNDIVIDAAYVREKFGDTIHADDLDRYII